MSLQKTLCLICERPTADGAVQAVHVDKEKLKNWFLNVCGHELVKEIEDDDLICYFCVWDAEEFDEMVDESLVWWNLDLDDAAKELRRSYLEGKLEPCWVQLEKIELPQKDGEERRIVEAERGSKKWNCIYCEKSLKHSYDLSGHMKKVHKEAIRCGNKNCATYFHTPEEKEEHEKNVHENSKEREKLNCSFCGKEFEGPSNYNKHVRHVHKDFPVKCSRIGCLSFLKTKIEMKTHFDSVHGKDDKAKKLQCNDCDYKTSHKDHFELHIARRHMPKSIKCKMCERLFSVEFELRMHVKRLHNFKVCKLCKLDVTVSNMQSKHLTRKKCIRCQSKFQCSGLYQSHLKSCRASKYK